MTTQPSGPEMTSEQFKRAAEEVYAQRDELDMLEEVDFVAEPDIRSVVSVRFSRGELKRIEQAAQKAGMPVSTYIRNAALATSETIDLDTARAALAASQHKLREAMAALSYNAGNVTAA
jgi:predicted DNA binding CopG/RHH family protein